MKEKRITKKLLGLLLTCIMLLGLMPTVAMAATDNSEQPTQPFWFAVKKTVEQGGNVAPGQETFEFELVYGEISENSQYQKEFTPIEGVSLADCGITFNNNTITTNGVGTQEYLLGGTIDFNKVYAQDGYWQDITGNDNTTERGISLKLTEKNDGKDGWKYSENVRYLTIKVREADNPGSYIVTTEVTLLASDVVDNNFENTYTAYSFTVKKTDESGNPLSGAVFTLTGTGNSIGENYEATSDANGIATFIVKDGFWGDLTEKTAPEGYIKSNDSYSIAIFDGEVNFVKDNITNVEYTNYQTVTFVNEKIVTASEETNDNTPKTGDDSNMTLWFVLLLASGAAITGTALYGKRKKYVK